MFWTRECEIGGALTRVESWSISLSCMANTISELHNKNRPLSRQCETVGTIASMFRRIITGKDSKHGVYSVMTVMQSRSKYNSVFLKADWYFTWGKKRYATKIGCRSLATVVGNKNSKIVYSRNTITIWKPCEVPKLEHFLKALDVFKSYFNRLNKASKKLQETFSLYNMAIVIMYFENLIEWHKKGMPSTYLFSLLELPCFLLLAYGTLKNNQSGGVDSVPLANVSIAAIHNLAENIRIGKYKPKPVKRLFVLKADGGKRPLGISSAIDKILQQAIYLILYPLFFDKFSIHSHGFIKNRSCHTALQDIYYYWPGTKWFIEFDILACFDKFQHPILLDKIFEVTHNYKLNMLINKLLRVGYINFANMQEFRLENREGSLQGSILSPLFCNVYLTSFDRYVEVTLLQEFNNKRTKVNSKDRNKGRRYLKTPWEPIYSGIKQLVEKRVSGDEIRKALSSIRAKDTALNKIRRLEEDPAWRVLRYVRYADDFLFGLIGPKRVGWEILMRCAHWLGINLGMNLTPMKCGVKHHEKGVIFLGYWIWSKYGLNLKWMSSKRRAQSRLNFSVPLEMLVLRFADRGFFHKAKWGKEIRYVGRRQDKWLFLNSDVEVVRRFNSVLYGVRNYYSGSTQKSVLSRFRHLMLKSCALTLAHRNKKTSSWWAFNKYGRNLCIKDDKGNTIVAFGTMKSSQPTWFSGSRGNIGNMLVNIGGVSIPRTLSAVVSASELKCAVVDCNKNAQEWHHITHQRKLKGAANRRKILAYTAKQLPMCLTHHKLIHSGKYDGPSLKSLKGYYHSDFNES